MADSEARTPDEIRQALAKEEALLEDVEHERAFLGKQTGQHIDTADFVRLDREIERRRERICVLREALSRGGG